MSADYSEFNARLAANLKALSEKDKDYWSFKGNCNREYGHGMFHYPAMMVPQVTQAIIDKILEVHPEIQTIRDPFVGSGTVMTETMLRGLSFSGIDINPLAILLCQVKSGPFFIEELTEKILVLKRRIAEDKKTNIELDYYNRKKWFTISALIWLSKIYRSIHKEADIWARKFFWVVFAETIRLTSNSRTSTFKLHIRTQEDITARKKQIHILKLFNKILDHNLGEYTQLSLKLQEHEWLTRGRYKKSVQIACTDLMTLSSISQADIIITSPPYGDNHTTVPYGQHSYLPLQWIDFADIDNSLKKEELLKTTSEIDSRSLGGIHGLTSYETEILFQHSYNLQRFIDGLSTAHKNKKNKVLSFFRDLDKCIDPILSGLADGGIMVWILGNRKVGGERVPLDKILTDMFNIRNVTVFHTLTRKIPRKVMPLKNNISETMSDETILFMRKDG